MSDLLKVTKVNSRQDSDLYSYDESVNGAWKNGENASLYSIAEDSREGRQSRHSLGDNSGTLGASPSPWEAGSAVEVRWRTEADEDGEPQVIVEDSSALPQRRDRRRCKAMTAACILCLVILAVILSVTLTNRDKDGERGAVMTGIGGDEPDQSAIETTARAVVLNALTERHECTSSELLTDPNTMQGQIFEDLVKEVAASAVEVQGGYRFSAEYGADMLAEKFAMIALFKETGGEYWVKNEGWGTTTDVCEWDGVVACADDRTEGGCGVTYLSIRLDGLYGQIPEELCCMKCLEELYLDGNRLKGQPPACLYTMENLKTIDLSSNKLNPSSDSSFANVFESP